MQTERKQHKSLKKDITEKELVKMTEKCDSEKQLKTIVQVSDIVKREKKFHEDFQRGRRDVMLDRQGMELEQLYLNLANVCVFRSAAKEVKHFNTEKYIQRTMVEKNGVLMRKCRILEDMEIKTVSEHERLNIGDLNLNTHVPVVDRHSMLAYSFAEYVHYEMTKHGGQETCYRKGINKMFIIGGESLYKEISEECIKCKKLRKKFLEKSMGPQTEHNLTASPPFYCTMADLFGPVSVYAPNATRDLRGQPARHCKVWVAVFVCPVTRLVNCQVIEKSDHGGFLDGVMRLAADAGYPKIFMVDQDGALMKGLSEAEVNMRDLQGRLYKQKGIIFTTCPVAGHNYHGAVERTIKEIQSLLERADLSKQRLHATGLQTLLKLVENLYNDVPLGYRMWGKKGPEARNGVLTIVSPNCFKFGRNNARAPAGPLVMPDGHSDLLNGIQDKYEAIYRIWNEAYIPRLCSLPGNDIAMDSPDLKEGNIVYFDKNNDNKLASEWTMGRVDQVIVGKDGKVRRIIIKYKNTNEEEFRTTDRAARSVVKLHDIDDRIVNDDIKKILEEVEKQFKSDRTTTVDPTDNIAKEASVELDNKMIEEMKKQIKLDGVHLLEFSTGNTKIQSPLQTNNLFSEEQTKICDNFVNKCLVVKYDEGSVFGKGHSEPVYCKAERDIQKDESLVDMILNTNFSP